MTVTRVELHSEAPEEWPHVPEGWTNYQKGVATK